jgi:hypothetical protein
MTVLHEQANGTPERIYIPVSSAEEKHLALSIMASLPLSERSFVVCDGKKTYLRSPEAEEDFDKGTPGDPDELYALGYDVEFCGCDSQKRQIVYIFAHDEQTWEQVRAAFAVLKGQLSPLSCAEYEGRQAVKASDPNQIETRSFVIERWRSWAESLVM